MGMLSLTLFKKMNFISLSFFLNLFYLFWKDRCSNIFKLKSKNELESGHGYNFNDENIKKDIEDLQLYIANQIINFKIKEIERKKWYKQIYYFFA